MKKNLRFFLLISILSTAFFNKADAQADVVIVGPPSLCVGECATYELVLLDSTDFLAGVLWQYNGIALTENPITVCMEDPNGILLIVEGFTEFQQQFTTEMFIEASVTINPVIVPTFSNCPDSLAACEKICAFNTAVYEVANVPPGTPVTWQVFGAESFTPDGHSVTVEWGAPGQGEVSVVVGGTGNPVYPLQIFCGMSGFSITNPAPPTGDGYLNIEGGTAPYIVELFSSTGIPVFSSANITDNYLDFPNLLPGGYVVQVVDADFNVEICNFIIAASDADCWLTIDAVEINHPFDCFECDGSITVQPPFGAGFVYEYIWSNGVAGDNKLTDLCDGTYSVTVIDQATDCLHTIDVVLACPTANTCVGEASLCVEILEEPQAEIAAIPPVVGGVIEICQGQTVYFENESINASTYIWDFGDLNTSTQFEPSHTYPTPGNYTVSLIARNECYCNDTTFVDVKVLPADVPDISCIGTVCEGESVTYSTTANCGTYDWSITGGGTVLDGGGTGDNFITVEWNTGPEGTISLAVSGCAGSVCTTPNVVPIPIISESAQIQGRTNVCEGSTEEYYIPNYQGTEINWSVMGSGNIVGGQGTERIAINWFGNANFNNPQQVIVEYSNCYLGCEGQDTLDVNIVPSFYALGPIEVCEKTVEDYTSHNSITNDPVPMNWEVFNSSGTSVWVSAGAANTASVDWNLPIGDYTLRALPPTAADFCNDKYEIFVEVIAAPPPVTAINGEDEICPGETYPYEADGIPINDFNWDFIGGTPTDFKGNPVNVTWGPTPPYQISVTQTATTGLACTSEPITMDINPIPAFVVTGDAMVCMEETGNYTAPYFEQVDYQWTISPADRGTVINGQGTPAVEILWHKDGPATVEVAVCGAVQSYAVTVLPLPDPQVGAYQVCYGTMASVQTTVPYNSYRWLDDTGALLSTDPNPDLPGGYYEVEVIDANGCQGSSTFQVVELPETVITISVPIYAGLCPGGPSVTIAASTTTDGYDFQWYANGVAAGTNTPYLTVDTGGSYSVVVTDQNGCTNEAKTNILDCEDAGGNCINGICVGGQCNNPNGCNLNGAISFQIQKTGDCMTHQYINTSVNDVSGSWFWNFDDAASGSDNTSALENPTHTFTDIGFYSIIFAGQVQALPSGTCPDGMLRQDTIMVRADFEFESACPGVPVEFTDITEILPYATLTNWDWDFDDPSSGADNTSTDQHPTHTFQTSGTYDVTLTVTEADGCQTSVTKNVTVYDLPAISFDLPTISCENTALPFSAIAPTDVTEVAWDFGDPASGEANSATKFDTHHSFGATGIYSVTLAATNIYGCTADFTDDVTVTPNTLGGNIAYSQPSPICEGDNITLTAPAGGIDYLWSTSEPTDQITVATGDVYEVTLTDADGCTYSPPGAVVDVFGEPNGIIKAVEYNEFGQPVAFYENNYTVCEGEDVYLLIQGSLDYSYVWSDGNSGDEISFTEERNNPLPVGNHDFTVTVTDNTTGCTSEEGPFTVTVNPKPSVQIASVPNGFLCENDPATLNVVSPNANFDYTWNTGETGTSIDVIAGGTYFAQAVNQFGCKSRSNEIVLNNAPDIDNIPTGCHTRCDPDTMCLPNMPLVSSYQWYHDNLPMSAPNGNLAEPIFDQSGEYYVVMTDIFGCQSTSDVLTLDLYPGFGDVLGNVYYDVNGNGVIDAADTLVAGIDIFLNNGTNNIDTVTSDLNGYAFPDILSTNYDLVLDTASLPAGWTAYFTEGNIELIGCDVEEQFDWLLSGCQPETFDLNFQDCNGVDYNGTFVPAGTTETFTFLSVLTGCDSVVTVAVEAIPLDTTQQELNTCTGTTVEYEGVDLSPGDQQDFILDGTDGCDSVVQVSVGEWPTYLLPEAFMICENSFVDYNGTTLYPGDQQDFTFTSVNGCDSVMQVSVEGFAADTSQQSLNACPGSTITYQGINLSPGDQQDFAFTDADGCDSIVQVSVAAWPTYTLPLPLTACENGSVIYNGQTLYPGDQQDFIFTSVNGCDSVMQVSVGTIPSDTSQQQLNACPGSTIIYQGVDLSPGDQQDFSLIGTDGCDSIVQVSVTAWPTYTIPFSLTACENGSVIYNGQTLYPGDQQDFIFTTVNGCDSIMQITVIPAPADTVALPLQACLGETVEYNGQQLTAGDQMEVILVNQFGCDSVIEVSVSQYPEVTFDLMAGEICWNGTDGSIEVQNVTGGAAPYLVSLDGIDYQPALTFDNLEVGTYTVYLLDDSDCQYEQAIEIPMIPQMVVETTDETMECGDELELEPFVSSQLPVTWQWTDGSTDPTLLVSSPGVYDFSVSNNCETINESVSVGLRAAGLDGMIYMPNSFSPNDDGINDCYQGYLAADLEVESFVLKIFDRWGDMMFETNNPADCWDGVFRGKSMQPAVFAWYMELHVRNCDGNMLDIFEEGDIHLMK